MRYHSRSSALASASLSALAVLLVWAPGKAQAQAFAGAGTVITGGATIDRSVAGVDTIRLGDL